jgi:hypothetical protein
MTDDAQRTMEQRSLRNVRALLDKLERDADRDKRTRRIIGWTLAVTLILGLGAMYIGYRVQPEHATREIVLTPPAR